MFSTKIGLSVILILFSLTIQSQSIGIKAQQIITGNERLERGYGGQIYSNIHLFENLIFQPFIGYQYFRSGKIGKEEELVMIEIERWGILTPGASVLYQFASDKNQFQPYLGIMTSVAFLGAPVIDDQFAESNMFGKLGIGLPIGFHFKGNSNISFEAELAPTLLMKSRTFEFDHYIGMMNLQVGLIYNLFRKSE